MRLLLPLPFVALAAVSQIRLPAQNTPFDAAPPRASAFDWPTDAYRAGLRGRGNFGTEITRRESPFHGSWHLGEDVWLRAGTEVRSIAAGVVRYSDFSPSWKDADGHIHWNLGNVIVIEHELDPKVGDLTHVCSVYVHLGADRKVKVGERVAKGQPIGVIGRDKSEENGLYPAHLHFGIHVGPWFQISPAWQRQLEEEARTTGIAVPDGAVRGEIEITRVSDEDVLVQEKGGKRKFVLSLLVGSTAPKNPPADIMGWCSGYGDERSVAEWLRPSEWIAARIAESPTSTTPSPRK